MKQSSYTKSCHSKSSRPQDLGILRVLSSYLNKKESFLTNNTYVEDPRVLRTAKPGMRALLTMARAFTLMELMVAVIIIAVLAAVALPMYKHTVMKSKFSAVIPPTKALADAQEAFYLNNGNYAFDKEEIDLSVPMNSQITITLSDKKNYKYVMGEHSQVPGAKYLIYQKHSKRFADNIHCEAHKDDATANWLCEAGLGGTLLTGSISGTNYRTYLISGNAGTDKFLREDCPAGKYDKDGKCTPASQGYYAEDGEQKACPAGTFNYYGGRAECSVCSAGNHSSTEGSTRCTPCGTGTYQPEEGQSTCITCPDGTIAYGGGHAECSICPAGTISNEDHSRCIGCGTGTYQPKEGQSTCITCPDGTIAYGGGHAECTPCPEGKTSNADHSRCI